MARGATEPASLSAPVSLQVSEARLTGESRPVDKVSAEASERFAGHETAYPPDRVLRGTIVADDIQDNDDAFTRFVLVRLPGDIPEPTGADKTTLSLYMHQDEPGALLAILNEFAVRGRDGSIAYDLRADFGLEPDAVRALRDSASGDLYVGGAEHAVLHLMYARFVTMALHDLGLIEFEEPFTKIGRAHV